MADYMVQIPKHLQPALIQTPESIPGAHVVTLILEDGTNIPGITVVNTCVAIVNDKLNIHTKDIQTLKVQNKNL